MGEIQGVTGSIQQNSRRGKQETSAARKKEMVGTMEFYGAISKKKKGGATSGQREIIGDETYERQNGHGRHTFERRARTESSLRFPDEERKDSDIEVDEMTRF